MIPQLIYIGLAIMGLCVASYTYGKPIKGNFIACKHRN